MRATFRRIAYLWFITLAGLALSTSQFLWALTPSATDVGLLSVLAVTAFGAFAAFGAAVYYASAARSRHISGETSMAWMGFVPFVNLYLLFQPGTAPSAEDGPPTHSKLKRYLLDPALVFGAIAVLAFTQLLDKELQTTPVYDPADSAVLRELMTEAQTLEESFALEAELSGAELPIRIDEITILSEIEAEGGTLRITYDVEEEIDGFLPDFESTLAEMQCTPEMFADDIARGGKIEMIYRGPSGRIIEVFEITKTDCEP